MTQSTLQLLLPGSERRTASMARNPLPGPSGAASLPPVPGATASEERPDKGEAFADLLRQQHPELSPPKEARGGKNLPQEGRSLPLAAQTGRAEAADRAAESLGPDSRAEALHPVWQAEEPGQSPLPFNLSASDWQRPGRGETGSLPAQAFTHEPAEQRRLETTPSHPLLEATAGPPGEAEPLQHHAVSRAGEELLPPRSAMKDESTDQPASQPVNSKAAASANGLSQEPRGQESPRPLQTVISTLGPAQANPAREALRTEVLNAQPGDGRLLNVDTAPRMYPGSMDERGGTRVTESKAAQQAANPSESGFRPAVANDQALKAALKEPLTPTTMQAAMDTARRVPVTNSVPLSSRDRAADWRDNRLERPGLMSPHNPEAPQRPVPVADTPVGERLQRFIEQFNGAMSERNGGSAGGDTGPRESREAPNPAVFARGETLSNANPTTQLASAQGIQGQAQAMTGQMQPGTALPGTLRSDGANDWMSAERSLAGTTAREQWGEKLGQRIAMMVAGNHSQARIQLDPPELGSLMIQLQLKGEQATVNFASPHGMVREALEGSISRLQDMLAEQGVDLLDVNVSDQSFGEQPGDSETGQQGTLGGEDGDSELTTELPTLRSDALIDYYV